MKPTEQPLVKRPTLLNAEDVIPDDKRSDKTLREIMDAIQSLLKPYRSNVNIGIEMADGKPYIIKLNFEIFLK